jgi:hypothetical protein
MVNYLLSFRSLDMDFISPQTRSEGVSKGVPVPVHGSLSNLAVSQKHHNLGITSLDQALFCNL